VATREGILRGQYVLVRATGAPTPLGRSITVQAAPAALAYGVTPRLALFGIVPYFDKSLKMNTPSGRIERSASGKDPGRFTAPAGLAVDSSGSLSVADFYNHRVQKFRSDGSFEKIFGHPGRMGAGALHYPTGVAVTPEGKLLVADAYNYRIQWFDAGGNPIRRVGDHLFWLWPLRTSSKRGFKVPTGVAVGSNGLIHVADSGNHRIVMLSAKGEYMADWSIPDSNPKVFSPEQVAVSRDGETVYATDLSANRVLILVVESQPAFQVDGAGKR
jgi:DNA-binding beta-propeller fold protein YncE